MESHLGSLHGGGNEEDGEDLELKEEVGNNITLTPNSGSRVHINKLVIDEKKTENEENDEDREQEEDMENINETDTEPEDNPARRN